MIHAIMADGKLERFDGRRIDALEHVMTLEEQESNAEILFSVDSQSEYTDKLQARRDRTETKIR